LRCNLQYDLRSIFLGTIIALDVVAAPNRNFTIGVSIWASDQVMGR